MTTKEKKVLVQVHVFHEDLWPTLREYLANITKDFDLYVTLVRRNASTEKCILEEYPFAHIIHVDNRGFDVAPFITVLNSISLDDYSYVIKLHTKRDMPVGCSLEGSELGGSLWRAKLLIFLSSRAAFQRTVEIFEHNPRIGMIAHPDLIIPVDEAHAYIDRYAHRGQANFIKKHGWEPADYTFVAGTMFMARAYIFEKLQGLLTSDDFPLSNSTHESQLAHVMERVMGYLVLSHDLTIHPFPVPGTIKRQDTCRRHHTNNFVRFVYQRKMTRKGRVIIKVLKVPVYIGRKHSVDPMSETPSMFKRIITNLLTGFIRDKRKRRTVRHYLFSKAEEMRQLQLEQIRANVEDPSITVPFVPLSERSFARQEGDCKLIAFYLPQFHAIDLNDRHFGKGFTEWTNVAKATPQFIGHHQPQIPIDVGFYDLSHVDVMFRQIELARQYGLYGFCFHYYWFSGKRLLEKPIFNYLNNQSLDFPFCLCWANENWSTLWDGGDRKVIMKQELKQEDFGRFWDDIKDFFADQRYIKINNSPLLIVYRPSLFDNQLFTEFVNTLRELAKRSGYNDLFILRTNFKETGDCREWACEGTVQFPPHGLEQYISPMTQPFFIKENSMVRYDMKSFLADSGIAARELSDDVYRGAFPAWDNTARKCHSGGCVFSGITPEGFTEWLKECIKWTKGHHDKDHQFVFINAWNEWGEGAHLEPDTKYGYAHLEAVKKALEESR